jgi:hypothetical protein
MEQTSVTFWLDGHYSSDFQLGTDYIITAKGAKDTPIFEELNPIISSYSFRHMMLIDDAMLFTGNEYYPTKKQLQQFVKYNLPDYIFSIKKDFIRILPKN